METRNEPFQPPSAKPKPLFTVEFADMTGEGWSSTASVLLRHFLEVRKLGSLIGVENSGTRSDALGDFDAGMGDLKPRELLYAMTQGYAMNGDLPAGELFLTGDDLERVEDLLDLPLLLQLELLDPKHSTLSTSAAICIREIARRCIQQLMNQERQVQFNARQWLAGEVDPEILTIAAADSHNPQQTTASLGRRLIITMTESDSTAIISIAQDLNSVYDRKGRVIAREGTHRLIGNKYEGLAGLLDPQRKSEPVVVARLLYFTEGKNDPFKNPWEIRPVEHLPYSKRLQELVRRIADSLQWSLRDIKALKSLG